MLVHSPCESDASGWKSEASIWANCVNILLGLLEETLNNENTPRYRTRKHSITGRKANKASNSYPIGSGISTPKRKRSFSDEARERKMQKISLNLANDIARSLSVGDSGGAHGQHKRRISTANDDTDMFIDEATTSHASNFSDTQKTSLLNDVDISHDGILTESSQPVLRSITELLSTQTLFGNSDPLQRQQWMMQQAQTRGMDIARFEMELRHKEQQLQAAVLALSQSHDIRVNPDKEFAYMKRHLELMSKTIAWIEHDHQWPIEQVFPGWKYFKDHIEKVASYVHMVDDMLNLTNTPFERSDDLLTDIRRLQSQLDDKTRFYNDHIIQGGLQWKAMGFPAQESLIASVKGYFHSLCIGLVSELHLAYATVTSQRDDIGDRASEAAYEKIMEAILEGLEFIGSSMAFTGLGSNKLITGCMGVGTAYGTHVASKLNSLIEEQQPMLNTQKATTMAVDQASKSRKPVRVDIEFMRQIENMTRILAAIQLMQEIYSSSSDYFNSEEQLTDFLDRDKIGTVEGLTSAIIDVAIRAASIIEIHQSGQNNHQRPINIMIRPSHGLVYMEESLFRYTSKVMELSGREARDGSRIQVTL
ncbi:hypothetical protein NQZ79_g6059 [Umbelopsis isabellina]|nr:hypothetical protein NQZ79_g6059 [Umbelopsis isabellina]